MCDRKFDGFAYRDHPTLTKLIIPQVTSARLQYPFHAVLLASEPTKPVTVAGTARRGSERS